MKSVLERQYSVDISNVDMYMNLSLVSLMKFFQDMATRHSMILGISYFDLKEKDNAFWVLSKFKVQIKNSLPVWGDEISIKTYPLEPQNIRSIRNYVLHKGDELLMVASSEWCILDSDTRKPRRTSSISCYSNDVNYLAEKLETEEFSKIVGEVEDGDFVYVKTVKLCDLDVNRHMNNVVYTEIVLNCFSADFLCDKKFNSYEVHFLKEAREGDNIKVYKKEESGGFVVVGKNDNGENYFKASIDFEKM